MDLEIRHLRLVAAVAEVGSLTRAGDQLHLTQSALSHQLRDIESRLGTALFLRVGKRLVLTPAGERLLASATDVLDRLRAGRARHPRDGPRSRRQPAHHDRVLHLLSLAAAAAAALPPDVPAGRGPHRRRSDASSGGDAAGRQDRPRADEHAGARSPSGLAPRVRRRAGADRVEAPPLRAAERASASRRCATRRCSSTRRKRRAGRCRTCCCRQGPRRRGSRKCS